MASRKPLVVVSGRLTELASTDTLDASVAATQPQSYSSLTVADGTNYMQLSRMTITSRLTVLGTGRAGVL